MTDDRAGARKNAAARRLYGFDDYRGRVPSGDSQKIKMEVSK